MPEFVKKPNGEKPPARNVSDPEDLLAALLARANAIGATTSSGEEVSGRQLAEGLQVAMYGIAKLLEAQIRRIRPVTAVPRPLIKL